MSELFTVTADWKDPEWLGHTLHRQLRKSVDTRYSVLLYNIIHAVNDWVYTAFGLYVAAKLRDRDTITAELFQQIMRGWNTTDYHRQLAREKSADTEGLREELDYVLRREREIPITHAFDAAVNVIPLEDCRDILVALTNPL